MRPFDPRLLHRAGATRGFLLLTVLLGALLALTVLGQAFLLSRVLAAVVRDGAGLADVDVRLGLLLGVVALRAGLLWAQESASVRASARVRSQLRAALLRHVVALGPGRAGGPSDGELAQVAARGVDALDGYFARYLPQLVLTLLVPGAVLLAMAWADPLSALVVLLTLPLVPFFLALVGMTTQAAQRRQWQALERLGHHFLDVVAGLATLRVFGRGRAQAAQIEAATEDYRRRTMQVLRVSFLSAFVLELAATLSVALVAVSVGLRLQAGEVPLATALLVLLLAPEAYLPLRQVGASYHAAAEGVAAGTTVLDVLDTPVPVRGASVDLPDVARVGLRLRQVAVAYPGRGTVLDPVDVDARPGVVTALTGPSGGGKSSLVLVVLGLVAAEQGRVMLGGVDLRDADPARWHRQVAWCPQRPALLAATVAANVRLGSPGADDRQVARALHLAAAEDLDSDLLIGEDGVGLSAGQRQRIGLARAFCRAEVTGAGLLLLDEPTSHLDAETELRVAASVRHLARERCVLLVAHRGALLEQADEVVELGAQAAAAADQGPVSPVGPVRPGDIVELVDLTARA